MALVPREEAEADTEMEVAATGGGATLWPGSLGEGSWWVLVDWAPLCEPNPPYFLDFSLEALSVGEDMECLASFWEGRCL